ncbi:MAG: tyrosine--tRNA ligase [Anaerolineales bacterium]|jgi:tyrosyl-tRNA synthetase
MARRPPIDEQVSLLMRGSEFGDDQIKQSMQDELRAHLQDSERSGVPLRVYCGFDPTKPDIHLGHTVPMRKLRQFQELGHQAIFVIGSFTAMVGDPSDKDAARPRLTFEQVMANAETYTEQAFKILDREQTEVAYNHEWLSKLTMDEFTEMASRFTVQQFLVRDNFAKRYENGTPIWLHELFYSLLQSYDAVVLKADVQLGGTEQLFNLLAGRKLQESFGLTPQVALTMPVLVGTDGHMRMSKSTGNYIGIDEPAKEMFGKVMSIPDSAMLNYFELVTRWTPKQIREIERDLEDGKLHPMEAKMKLAREIVAIYHGDEAVEAAEASFRRVVQQGDAPKDMPDFEVDGTKPLVDIMLAAGLVKSKSEARRLIKQGGVRLDDATIEDTELSLEIAKPTVLRVGKRRFVRLIP